MGRLIDADALIENFRKCYSGHMGMENSDSTMMFKSICRVINEQPTAYDSEKVLEGLEEAIYMIDDSATLSTRNVINDEEAIDIVKRGGVE